MSDIFAGLNRGAADPDKITMDTFSSGDNNSSRKGRYAKFGEAFEAASKYKRKREAENQVDAAMGKSNDDEKSTQGFKIAPDATVVEGYRDPGYTIQGQKGPGILGTIGAAVTPFAPITGQVIGGIGGVTGF
tara:strand:- start:782 stop:1177 length:396 start_codon:yes stop_codon:yes gene_type:complete